MRQAVSAGLASPSVEPVTMDDVKTGLGTSCPEGSAKWPGN